MKKISLLLGIIIISKFSFANNIVVTNASLSAQNTTNKTYNITFDLAWENSWRTSTNESNYDGAWVFVKFRKNNTGEWRHATLKTTGFTIASGGTMLIPADQKGAFMYRSADGIGNISFASNTIVWDYGFDGALNTDTFEIKVFALEMVYIPQGGFVLGSGGIESNCFKTGATANPYPVTSSTITFGTTGTDLNTNGLGPTSGTLSADFPTGYKAFWIMKYETSQQQFVDFLNHLDILRATANNSPAFVLAPHPAIIPINPERAMTSVSSQRLAALADWSALRPFTEMEYEKACRGSNISPIPNEYPWGNTNIFNLTAVANSGLLNETPTTPTNTNVAINNGQAFRVGLFARASGSTRELSGATYYGVLNMADNVTETCIGIVNPQGRAFTDIVHGDGYLNAAGNTDLATWNAFQGYGYKGGAYNSATTVNSRISDRQYVNLFTQFYGTDNNSVGLGARMARTAP